MARRGTGVVIGGVLLYLALGGRETTQPTAQVTATPATVSLPPARYVGEADVKAKKVRIIAPGFMEHSISENVIAGNAMS